MNKLVSFKNWLKKERDYLISLGILLVLFLVFLLSKGIWPFGKNVVLLSDSYEQIGPFFEHIFDVLSGRASLFYTGYLAGGFEVFSTLEYMLLSPFYLVLFLGGRANYMNLFTLSLLLMLCFNTMVFIWFANKHFPKLSSVAKVMLAILFCFSGYVVQNTSFLTWLIYPGITLILAHNYLRLLDGKIYGFILSLIWYVLNCFSVGISTSIILFLLFSLHIFFSKSKQERKQAYANLFLGFLVSAILCFIILFPAVIDVLKAPRAYSIFQNLFVFKSNSFLRKTAVLFADAIPMLLTIIYFVKCKKSDKNNKFLLFAFILLIIPTLFDSVQKLLAFGSYQGFLSRFYFLTDVFIFILSMKFLSEQAEKEVPAHSCQNRQLKVVFGVVTGVLVVTAIFVFVYLILKADAIGLLNKTQRTTEQKLIYINIAVFLVVALGFVEMAIFKKAVGPRLLCAVLAFVSIFSLGLNFIGFTGFAGREDNNRKEINQLLRSSQTVGSYKILSSNIANFSYNFISSNPGLSVFSSLLPEKTQKFYASLGYQYTNVAVNSSSGNLISDAILGIKFFVSDTELDRPYLTFVNQVGSLRLYQNELTTTGAFASDKLLSFDTAENYIQNFENLNLDLGLSGTLISPLSSADFEKTTKTQTGLEYSFTAKCDGLLYSHAMLIKKSDGTFDIDALSVEGCQELTFLRAGETYTFNVNTSKTTTPDDIRFEFLDYEAARNLILKLKESEVGLTQTKMGYDLNFDYDTEKFIYFFRPNIDGMKYSQPLLFEGAPNSAFEVFKVSSNEKSISATYSYPHKLSWLAVLAAGAVLVAALLIAYHYTKFKHIQTVLTYAIYGVNCCILALFYFFGVMLSFIVFSL